MRDLFDVLSEAILFHIMPTKQTESNRITADTASIEARIPHIMSLAVNTDICRMITEMMTEEYPWRDQPCNNELPMWSSKIHSPGTCFLCEEERQREGSAPAAWFGDFESCGANFGSHGDDELFAFPGLFGSVEF